MRQPWVRAMAWYLEYSRDTAFNYHDGKPDFAVGIMASRWSQVYGRGEKGSDTLASHLSQMMV
jgi:hypothetical protein